MLFCGFTMIRLLIVDDSSFMRSAIKRMLQGEQDIEIVAEAKNGVEGLELAEKHKPDIITLDIEMPICNGLDMLEKLMQTNPTPVIMLSSLTTKDAEPTLKALELGALDFMPKYKEGATSINDLQNELIMKIRIFSKRAAMMRLRRTTSIKTAPPAMAASSATSTASSRPVSSATMPSVKLGQTAGTSTASSSLQAKAQKPSSVGVSSNDVASVLSIPDGIPKKSLVGIGVSTGGPPAIQKVLTSFPKNFPACIFIAQHMPASFTNAFAARLDSLCEIKVKEAATGDPVEKGTAYVCPGGKHLKIEMRRNLPYIVVTEDPIDALYKPSANVLFESLADFSRQTVGVMMTGMGNDGLEGMKVFKQKNGKTIAQDEQSCVVYGMPKAIVDAGLADEVVPLDKIASKIIKALYE